MNDRIPELADKRVPSWLPALVLFLFACVFLASVIGRKYTAVENIETGNIDANCDMHQKACQATFENAGTVRLAISPNQPIKPLTQLNLEVDVEGVSAEAVRIDFKSLDLFMGFNRPRLEKVGVNKFTGTGLLATCTLGSMRWEANVLVTTPQGTLSAPFRFEVQNRP